MIQLSGYGGYARFGAALRPAASDPILPFGESVGTPKSGRPSPFIFIFEGLGPCSRVALK